MSVPHERSQHIEVNADEPTVISHFNRPVAVLISWETWQAMKQALEAKK